MSEQKRVMVAVVLCLGILLGWQFLAPKPPPRPAQGQGKLAAPSAEADKAAPKVDGASVAAAPAAAANAATAPQPPTPAGAPSAEGAAVPTLEERSFATPLFRGKLANHGASLTALELANYKESVDPKSKDEQPVSLVTAKKDGGARQALLEWSVDGKPGPALAFVGAEGLALSGTSGDGLETRVSVVPEQDGYVLVYSLRAENRGTRPVPVGVAIALGLEQHTTEHSFFAPPADVVNGVCYVGEKAERHGIKDVAEGPRTAEGLATWAGLDRQYFVIAAALEGEAGGHCVISGKDSTLWVRLEVPTQELAPGGVWERKVRLFAGPKRSDSLAAAAPALREAIDYNLWGIPLGFLARPMVYVLNVFHGATASWGLAIMLLTFLVKALLFPVTYKSAVSMKKMQELKPELDKLRTLYPNDKERQQVEQLKLFRERGVNPLGGCLPMLLQMPVWFALYRTLWSAVDLYHQPFLWIANLTAPEPFPFMAIGVGALTFVQQRMTPMSVDQQQMKTMLYIMPLMFSVFLIALPSGLVLYILVNSILTIVQQVAINRQRTS